MKGREATWYHNKGEWQERGRKRKGKIAGQVKRKNKKGCGIAEIKKEVITTRKKHQNQQEKGQEDDFSCITIIICHSIAIVHCHSQMRTSSREEG